MDKRGDIATILIFVVTLVLVMTSLFSFASFNNNISEASRDIENIVVDYQLREEIIEGLAGNIVREALTNRDSNGGILQENIVNVEKEIDSGVDVGSNLFGKIRNKEFKIVENGEVVVFSVDDLFVRVAEGDNQILRTFDLEVTVEKS